MASKRAVRRQTCESKKKYDTPQQAYAAALRLAIKVCCKTSYYKCKFCGKYHVGRTPKKVKIARRAMLEKKMPTNDLILRGLKRKIKNTVKFGLRSDNVAEAV